MLTSLVAAVELGSCFEFAVLSSYPAWVEAKHHLQYTPWFLIGLLFFLAGPLGTCFGRRCKWLCGLLTHEATICTLTLATFAGFVVATILTALPEPNDDPMTLQLINAASEMLYKTAVGDGGFGVWAPPPPAIPPPPLLRPAPPSLPPMVPWLVYDTRLGTAGFFGGALVAPVMLCGALLYVNLGCCPRTAAKFVRRLLCAACCLFHIAHAVIALILGVVYCVVVPLGALLLVPLAFNALVTWFSIMYFYKGLLYMLFGMPRVQRNTEFNRARPRDPAAFNRKPLLILTMPVFSEDLHKTIEPTLKQIDKSRRRYEAAGGKAIVLVTDDGLKQGIAGLTDSDSKIKKRRRLFQKYRAIWVA